VSRSRRSSSGTVTGISRGPLPSSDGLAVARHLPLGRPWAGDRHSQVLRRPGRPRARWPSAPVVIALWALLDRTCASCSHRAKENQSRSKISFQDLHRFQRNTGTRLAELLPARGVCLVRYISKLHTKISRLLSWSMSTWLKRAVQSSWIGGGSRRVESGRQIFSQSSKWRDAFWCYGVKPQSSRIGSARKPTVAT
jgi:hypothetical protein